MARSLEQDYHDLLNLYPAGLVICINKYYDYGHIFRTHQQQ